MYKKQNIYLFICFITLLLIVCNSCILDSIFDREGIMVYLIEKKTISDTKEAFQQICSHLLFLPAPKSAECCD